MPRVAHLTLHGPAYPLQALLCCRRPDKMRDMTYTQFWNLVRERKVDTVSAPAAAARLPAAARPGRKRPHGCWAQGGAGGMSLLRRGSGWPAGASTPAHQSRWHGSPFMACLLGSWVPQARYSTDRRTIYVTTKANAPGGVRTGAPQGGMAWHGRACCGAAWHACAGTT